MIRSFRHKGLRAFYETGNKVGIQPDHVARIARQLARLEVARTPEDMNVPGWKLHPLHGSLQGHYAVSVNGNWRITFVFEDGDAILVDYLDYH
ncbi:type II toxin-antitoxin system RelE/ParE family toxin [Acidithiobacillus caldus]|uniref:Peptidase n=1 Tax=Acidithiobacillus caldus TaxID=33059 RepID=A0A1E7YPW8_9PROT|nr:type II toxin-antitoxin system RelE/ParE family toxin [Acidithiobacillus caldus]OFC37638.1 peptidase [Acidithiobacillus caldus]OFC37746.1 peptidase [Acidithiobacillus caldus]OFC37866.1 peptidase [Acidithiobacillus caldus]